MHEHNGNGSQMRQGLVLFHQLELVLRQAAKDQIPLTVRDIYDTPAIKGVAKGELQVRDKIKTLHEHNLLVKVTVAESKAGDKRARIGYMWRDETKTVESLGRHGRTAKVTPPHEKPITAKDIELVVGGVTIVVGRNEETGRLRIVIEH